MDIKAYLKKHELSQGEFGKLVGVSQARVSQWIEAGTGFTVDRVKAIVRATKGEIAAHDLMPKTFPPGFEFPKPRAGSAERKAEAA